MNPGGLDDRVGLLVRSKTRFLQFLERRLGGRADAEDVLQAAFLRLVARGESLRSEEKLIPWFYQLLRNLLVDHYRHRNAMLRLEQGVAAEAETTTSAADQDLFQAVCTCVNGVLAALKPEPAEMIRRVELAAEPIHRVAEDPGITPNNASVRLHRARRAVRDALRATCGVCAEHGCLDCGCRQAGHP
jgi:RNA polymerase sigma-70 factor (ECF subfamily)